METRIRFSDYSRVGKGYLFLNGVKCYIEVWHSVVWQQDQLRVFYPKGMAHSYIAGKTVAEWHHEEKYMWCNLPHKACVDTAIAVVIAETNLKFFEESRKWLTKEEKEVAHMLAVDTIGICDAETLLKCDVSDLPRVFHEEVNRFRNEYYGYLQRRDWALYKSLNTYEGLTEALRLARRSGNVPAVSWFKHLIWDLTELWEK